MIYIVAGLPGAGKTYLAVSMALDKWRKDRNHKIFSNFPIKWKNCSSFIWKPEYVTEDIYDSTVIIDEAYRDYNSRDFKSFSDDSHLAFATSRHNGMDFIFIAQSVARIDKVIREIANEIFVVHKRAIPGIDRPLWFFVESFDGEESLKMRAVSPNAVYRTFRSRFRKEVAKAYDTLQYRKESEERFSGELWYPECNQVKSKISLINQMSNLHGHLLSGFYFGYRHRIRDKFGSLLRSVLLRAYRGRETLSERIPRLGRWVRTDPYDLWEPRGIFREIAFRNWVLWRPLFRFTGEMFQWYGKKIHKIGTGLRE